MKTQKRYRATLIALCAATAALSACRRENPDGPTVTSTVPPHASSAYDVRAVARMNPTQGNEVRGTVQFRTEADAVRVSVDLAGLSPGQHGIHIHENGDCSSPDASSAGGHFNPTNQPHGAPADEARHLGDLGNIMADAEGKARLSFVDPNISLAGDHSIIGRSIVVHSGADDLKSQPSGASGSRVACGTIEVERKNF